MDSITIITLIKENPFFTGIALGILFAGVIALLLRLVRRRPDTFEAFCNEAGKIVISRQALEAQIQRCCEDLVDIGKARVKVIYKKGILSVRIRLRIRSNGKLVGISGILQNQVSSVLHKNLGIENVGPIDIIVTGILPQAQEETTSIKPDEKTVADR